MCNNFEKYETLSLGLNIRGRQIPVEESVGECLELSRKFREIASHKRLLQEYTVAWILAVTSYSSVSHTVGIKIPPSSFFAISS